MTKYLKLSSWHLLKDELRSCAILEITLGIITATSVMMISEGFMLFFAPPLDVGLNI